MTNQQESSSISIGSLMAEIAILESNLADKDSIIVVKDSIISKLTIDYEAARFQNEQLRRMIFLFIFIGRNKGSKKYSGIQ